MLGFGGGLFDSDTGLIHFGYREYDPVIGRFISPDPLGYDGGDVDLYGFCLDDPINFVDKTGLWGEFGSSSDGTSGNGYEGVGGNNTTSDDSKSSGIGGNSSLGGEGGGGSDSTSSKSSAQNARDMEAKAESLGYNTGLNNSSGGESSPTKSSAQHAREMEAKAKSLGYNTGLNNSRGGGESSPTKSSAQHAREMEQIARAKAQKEHEAEEAKLAEQKAIRDRRAKEVEERRDRLRAKINKESPMISPLTGKKMHQGPDLLELAGDYIEGCWHNMTEKEKRNQQRRDAAAQNLNPSKVTDIFSNDPKVRKNRANTIKAGVQDKLENYADVYLSTPDDKMTPLQYTITKMGEAMKRNKN